MHKCAIKTMIILRDFLFWPKNIHSTVFGAHLLNFQKQLVQYVAKAYVAKAQKQIKYFGSCFVKIFC